MAASNAKVARRVARSLCDHYIFVPQTRWNWSYRGGWQNSTQKLQWFWYGFKKYGFLANFANILRMREYYWESGEKRLIGMDALGHKYWETDEISRRENMSNRFMDYPMHFQWADWSKIPLPWAIWQKMETGRSPPQLEALQKELGPAWKDYLGTHTYRTSGYGVAEAETQRHPYIGDTPNSRQYHNNPFSPSFQKNRRNYGHSSQGNKLNLSDQGFTNLYDVDEFDPKGGALRKLEYEGLQPGRMEMDYASKDENDVKHRNYKFGSIHNTWGMKHRKPTTDHSSKIWLHFRKEEADKTRRSREKVSAFDLPSFSPVNETCGKLYAFESRYKTIDPTAATGFKDATFRDDKLRGQRPHSGYSVRM